MTSMPPSEDDQYGALGRAVVADGRLHQLQVRLQFSNQAMSQLLYVAPGTYKQWLVNPKTNLRPPVAVKVGRLYAKVVDFLSVLREEGIVIDDLVPYHRVAMMLGWPTEVLLSRFRADQIDGLDLELLGMWMPRAELTRLQREHHVAA